MVWRAFFSHFKSCKLSLFVVSTMQDKLTTLGILSIPTVLEDSSFLTAAFNNF
nr:MAG TPA: hypothetical protein [Caudoviricetes sp.]